MALRSILTVLALLGVAGCTARAPAREAMYGVLDAIQTPPPDDTLAREVRTLIQAYVERALRAGPPEDLGQLAARLTTEVLRASAKTAPETRALVGVMVSEALRASLATLERELPGLERTGARLAPAIEGHAERAGASLVRGVVDESLARIEAEPGGADGPLAGALLAMTERAASATARGAAEGLRASLCEGEGRRVRRGHGPGREPLGGDGRDRGRRPRARDLDRGLGVRDRRPRRGDRGLDRGRPHRRAPPRGVDGAGSVTRARDPDRSVDAAGRSPSRRTLRALDGLNFLLADVQAGVGPFLAMYLAAHGWNEERVGLALTICCAAGILMQTPAGGLVDATRSKRALVGAAVVALATGALVIALRPSLWPILGAQVLIGGTSSVFVPAVCAMSLGVVGRASFDTRQGRNQTFNSAGNVVAAVAMGLLGYLVSNRSIFFFVVALAVPTIVVLSMIRPAEIDYDLARGAREGERGAAAGGVRALFQDRALFVFLVCAVMFHFANAAMLPLLGEALAKGRGRSSMLFMAGCVVTTQLVITLIASFSGRKAGTWGRKPLLSFAFGVLPVRGVLYTLTSDTVLLVAIQALDGIAAAIFNVVSVLVIADLTRGTGRYNLALGAVSTAVGVGAALSQLIAGSIVHHAGSRAGFLFLAGVASAAFAVLHLFMPETRGARRPGGDRREEHARRPPDPRPHPLTLDAADPMTPLLRDAEEP